MSFTEKTRTSVLLCYEVALKVVMFAAAETSDTGALANSGNNGFTPPDTMGAVSPDFNVVFVNLQFLVYSR